MEKPLYPSEYMRITQGYNIGSHLNSYAIDEAGMDTGIDIIKAPFTGTIKKIYTSDANEIWLESNEQVQYPDGTIDYMTILFAHDNDVSDLYVGKIIKQGEVFYQEGRKGNTTGNHVHIECAQGKYIAPGWSKNINGNWYIINGKKPEECLWVNKDIKILNNNNYNFKLINEQTEMNKEETPIEETTSKEIFEYECKSSNYYAIYLNKGEELIIKISN